MVNVYEKLASENINSIPETYKKILDMLVKQEGNKLHRNSTEIDITTGTGIYKAEHKTADVFKYITEAANSIGIKTDSAAWSQDVIAKVDNVLNKETIYYYSYIFYKNYYANLSLDMFTPDVALDLVSLYANSPEGAVKSLQKAIFDLNKMGHIIIAKENIYTPGVTIGPKTKANLELIKNSSKEVHDIYNLLVLVNMKTYYITLVTQNKAKVLEASAIIPNLKYLAGWNNRVDGLVD